MITRILATTLLLVGLTQGALAQSTTPAAQPPTAPSTQAKQTIPQELRQKLTSAGYTDVEIVPSSFIVSAKNKEGNHVMMRVSPDSMTMLTEVPVSAPLTAGSVNAPAGKSSKIEQQSSTVGQTSGGSTK
jgi:hypothetical protein